MTWWEMSNQFNEDSPNYTPLVKETLRCPVCKHIVDHRDKSKSIFAYCKECKTTFFYGAGETIPSSAVPDSSLDCTKKSNCGCGRCGR